MSGVTWKYGGGTVTTANVFEEVSGSFTFTDDDVRAFHVDWGDGTDNAGAFSNKKEFANYQWVESTEPIQTIDKPHTYTATGTFNPLIQTMNSNGFFSKYYQSGTAGTLGVNSDVTPSIGDTGITKIQVYDSTATGIMRVENKTVKSGIDNSLFDKEGPKDLYVMIPPLCSGAELTTISTVELEITALVDTSMLTEADTTLVGGAGKSIQVLSYTGSSLSSKSGLDAVAITGGQVSKILKVVYKNPKYTTSPRDWSSNKAYQNLKIFLVAKGKAQVSSVDVYYPITYVSAGSPIKKAKDSTRYITMDFSQSRAKASNVSLNNNKYDLGKVWFNPVDQWAVSGSARSEYFGDQTKQLVATSELKEVSFAYNNVRPDGLNGAATYAYTAFSDSSDAKWNLDNATDQNKRVDQFLVDEFGRFTDQYHMIRLSTDPNTTDKDGTNNFSSIVDNQPYIFRMTPGVTGSGAGNDAMTKIDYSDSGVNYTADYTVSGVNNGSGSMISLSGMNTQSFTNMSGTSRAANEYLLLLFPSKTDKLFFNMNNYGNLLIDKNLQDTDFTTPWKISGVSYLCMENAGSSLQNTYWKPVEFEDTTTISMEYRDTSGGETVGTYENQTNSLSQSGYISYDMPPDWAATNLSGLCGYVGIDDAVGTAGTHDIVLNGSAISAAATATGYGEYVDMTVSNPSAIEDVLSDDDVGAFKYIFIITNDGGGAGKGEDRAYWVAKGAANGYESSTNKLSLHFGADIGSAYQPVKGTASVTGSLRRVNTYDIIDGYSKVYISGATKNVYYPVGAGATWDNTYMIGNTSTGVSQAMKTAWDTTDLYALKISLSGAANGSEADVKLYPELWNIFDATSSYQAIVREIDDTAYNLNALPITSDVSVSRGGTYYSAITRKGKVFITRTGDEIENITFNSNALGDESSFDSYSTPDSMYGQLRKIRNIHASNVRVYWDETQKDGTYVRYWGMVTGVDESHGSGGPRSVVGYSFNVMVQEIALLDTSGKLMTDLFPLGGIESGRNYS